MQDDFGRCSQKSEQWNGWQQTGIRKEASKGQSFGRVLQFRECRKRVTIPAETLDYLRNCFTHHQSVPEPVHQQMLQLFYACMIVGYDCRRNAGGRSGLCPVPGSGCVQSNAGKHSAPLQIRYCQIRQKYGKKQNPGNFDSIPAHLASKTSRFVLSRLKEGARMQRYENSFLWLREAGVALPRFNVSAPVTPLTLNGKRSLFKLFLCDTESLCEASLENLQVPLLQGEVGINAGSLLENVFAQSIAAKDMVLCYYDQKKFGELDFVLQNGRQVDLLEIKSGSDWKKHPSLSKAIDSDQWEFARALVFCKGNAEQEGPILYLPFYMIMFCQPEKRPETLFWKPEIDALLSFGLEGQQRD